MSKKHLKDINGKALCGIEFGGRIKNFTSIEFQSFDHTVNVLLNEDQDYICKRCKKRFIKLNKEKIDSYKYMNSKIL